MKLMNYTNIFSIFCITACALVSASPLVDLTARDVFDPHIIRPNEKTVWIVGTKRKVVWYDNRLTLIGYNLMTFRDTSNRPVNITNPIGMITLNKGGETTPGSLQEYSGAYVLPLLLQSS